MTIVITGAARGIGLHLAQGFAARGDHVLATTRSATAPAIAPLASLSWQCTDVTDRASLAALAASLNGGAVDLLVCNAGVYLDRADGLETGYDTALWEETFAVNVTGVFHTVQALLPHLGRARMPRIAIIASAMGSQTRAKGTSYIYRASKAAAINLGRNLATDLQPHGIAVGIYHPGWVRTDMGGAGADIDTATSATGLMARFDALSMDQTGAFLNYDGTPIAF